MDSRPKFVRRPRMRFIDVEFKISINFDIYSKFFTKVFNFNLKQKSLVSYYCYE